MQSLEEIWFSLVLRYLETADVPNLLTILGNMATTLHDTRMVLAGKGLELLT